ncbi:MAG: hypothetical protein CV089_00355 [Nitrospira sp. WS110]|nr:hypothetical protein [Nitrospira sp. WS110]
MPTSGWATLARNGVGFDPTHTWDGQNGVGIVGMRERLRLVGESLKINSQRGRGPIVIPRARDMRFTDGCCLGGISPASPCS